MRIVLIGASGFVGRHLVPVLAAHGHGCTVLSRGEPRQRSLRVLPAVRLVRADVYDRVRLESEFTGADVVFSMAGILNERGFGGRGFRRAHVELVEGIVEAARAAGVPRILHVSAMNAGQGRSHYLRTKGEAEALLLDSHLQVSIFRPSVIFGPGDDFFNRFAALLRLSPVLPLACPNARLQPVYVGDVVQAMVAVLEGDEPPGGSYDLGGPRVYTLRELVEWTAAAIGRSRLVIGLPDWASRLQGRLMGLVPGKPFSYDNYLSLQTDNVTPDNALPRLGITPAGIEAVVPGYLGVSLRQSRLDAWRRQPPRP